MSKAAVIDLAQWKEGHVPHVVGPGHCVLCGHEAINVRPVDAVKHCECPRCGKFGFVLDEEP